MAAAAALLCLTFPHPRPPSLALALALLPVLRPTRLQLRTFTRILTRTFTHTSHPLTPHHPHHTPHHPHHTAPRHATPRHATHTTPRRARWTSCSRWRGPAIAGSPPCRTTACGRARASAPATAVRRPSSLHLPISPYFSLYLPISPYISMHLVCARRAAPPLPPPPHHMPTPHAAGALLRHFCMHGRTVDDHTGRWGRCSRAIDVTAARC